MLERGEIVEGDSPIKGVKRAWRIRIDPELRNRVIGDRRQEETGYACVTVGSNTSKHGDGDCDSDSDGDVSPTAEGR